MTKQEVLNKLLQDAKLRSLSKHTQDEYYTNAKQFQDYYDKTATEMGIDEVRGYRLNLSEEKHLSSGSVNTYNSGLRFLHN
ncbi:MAG: phage integrase N-terminal SAM-like domain-containing protein [Defluviitaleaceae bacterium]|nr:phage integrase N-terminal SAM-like domain-containing protein [Defluviitaleaceae bacterium]